jgi:polar amino acid transport system substrate-binding protein
MALDGNVFGAFPYAPTPARQEKFDFSARLMAHRMVFFYDKQVFDTPPTWDNLADLKAYRIGGVRGFAYEQPFQAGGLNVHYVNSENLLVELLLAQRINLMITDELVGRKLIRQRVPQES